MKAADDTKPPLFYHGTRAGLKRGDLIAPGYSSDHGQRKQASWIYLTGTLDAAIWGAELAVGDGPGRIYVVEPTGAIEDDPNLTNKSPAIRPRPTASESRLGSRSGSRIGTAPLRGHPSA